MPAKHDLFVDTSGWVCIFDQGDPLHHQASMVYKTAIAQKRQLVTTNYSIAELVALLESRNIVPRQTLFTLIDQIKLSSNIAIICIDTPIDDEAWQLLKNRPDKVWSLVDATSFVIMRHKQITEALTTDHHFTQAGFIRLPAPK